MKAAALSVIVAAIGAVPLPARAVSLTPDAQIAVTRSGNPNIHTLWARLDNGNLASRRDLGGTDAFVWNTHQRPTVTLSSRGVAGTSWSIGGVWHQRIAMVCSDGALWQRVVVDAAATGWLGYPAPTGKTLTGHVAITWAYDGAGVRRVYVGVTTTDGGFHVLTYDPNEHYLDGTWSLKKSNVSTSGPLAASNAADGTYARFFMVNMAAGNTNQVWMSRVTGGAWSGYDLDAPIRGTTQPVCGTMAAAEGQTNTGSYATYLFCTKSGAPDGYVYALFGNQVDEGDGYVWSNKALGAGELARNTGYALAATRQGSSGYNAIDAYVLNTQTPDSKIYRLRHPALGGAIEDPVPLLADLETTQRVGGMTASPTGYGFSFVYFSGKVGSATRLYRGIGDPAQSSATSWRDHQSGAPRSSPFPYSTPGHAEGMIAMHRGRAVATGIVRPGPGLQDWPWVDVAWSTNDGDTWGAPAPVPQTGGDLGALELEYVSDPTADFTDIDSGQRAYVAVNGFRSADNDCASAWSDGAVYVVNTTNGVLSPPEVVTLDDDVDHPWIGIERILGGPDRIHVVWTIRPNVIYRTRVIGGEWEDAVELESTGEAPTLTIGAGSNVFVMDHHSRICHINAAHTGCDRWETLPLALQANWGLPEMNEGEERITRVEIPGSDPEQRMRLATGFSLKASRVTNEIYYAFNAREGHWIDHTDVYFARIHYDSVANDFTFSDPVKVTDDAFYGDGRDQFSPAVVVSHDTDNGYPIIAVSWYDRRANDGDCEGEVNRCFVVRRSVSTDGGLSFFDTQTIPLYSVDYEKIQSDPMNLPQHCREDNIRFHGDFHDVSEDWLHGRHYVIVADELDGLSRAALVSSWLSGGYYHYLGGGP